MIAPPTNAVNHQRVVIHFQNATANVTALFVNSNRLLSITKNSGAGSGTNNLQSTGITLPLNTTNLIVLRYRYKTGNTTDDEFTIWINPPTSSFGASEAAAPAGFFTNTTGSVADQAAIASVNIGNYTSSNSGGASFGNTNGGLMFLDEIRVATTWAEVTPSSCITATVTTSPTNRTIFSGLGTTFNSAATGDNVTNQWQYSSDGGANFIVISGATSADYTTNSVTTGADQFRYRVIYGAPCDGVTKTSTVATLTVSACVNPTVTVDPVPLVTMTAGQNTNIFVTATGSGVTYQWQKSTDSGVNYANLTGETSSTFTTNNVSVNASNNYFRCVVTAPCSGIMATSAASIFSVICGTAGIATDPSNQGVFVGSTATFTVVGSGAAPTYRWETNNVNQDNAFHPVTGATSASFTTPATTADQNNLQIRAIVDVSCDSSSATSAVRTLTVGTATTTSFRSAASGSWNANSSWELSANNGTTWFPSTTTPTDANNTNTLVRSPHSITNTASVSVAHVTVQSGATNIVNALTALTIADGSDAVDYQCNGVMRSAGTNIVSGGAGSLTFGSTGTYEHNYAAAGAVGPGSLGVIPTATWSSGSTCAVIGFTSPTGKAVWGTNTTHGLSQAFHHFVWACPNQTSSIIVGGVLTNIAGDFSFNGGAVATDIMSLGGVAQNVAGSIVTMTVGGNFTVSGTGKLLLDSNTSRTNIVKIGGNFTVSSGSTIDPFADTGATLEFTGATSQYTTTGGTVSESGSWSYVVDPGANLTLNSPITLGNGKVLSLSFTRVLTVASGSTVLAKAAITQSQTIAGGAAAGTASFAGSSTYTSTMSTARLS